MSEWQLIERYFRDLGARRDDVSLGIGDDAALLRVPQGMELVLTTDALIEGAHFLSGASPKSLGHRALAVNLSDIAAMGGTPTWALLSLNMPSVDDAWLHGFAEGFGAIAQAHDVALVGGNLGRGPLSITVELAGTVPTGQALRRDGAHAGDLLYVSGTLGDAAQSLLLPRDEVRAVDGDALFLQRRLEYPTPRVALGQSLRGLATACIDVSDGLYADVGHLASASGCGVELQVDTLPVSEALQRVLGANRWQVALKGGEDYELCFAAPAARAQQIEALADATCQPITRIGTLRPGSGITLKSGNSVMQFSASGFDHFRN